MFERWGRRWECLFGYAVTRSAWWFELSDITNPESGETVLFAMRPDDTGLLAITRYRGGLDPEIVEWFTAQAEIAIPPMPEPPPSCE